MDSKEDASDKQIRTNDFFKDPQLLAAKASLDPKQRKELEKRGEFMYNTVDFENPESDIVTEGVAYILSALKSGLHPRELTDIEKEVLRAELGDQWYLKFGYTIDQLYKPVEDRNSKLEQVAKKLIRK